MLKRNALQLGTLLIAFVMALASYSGVVRISQAYYIASIVVFCVFAIMPHIISCRVNNYPMILFLVVCLISIMINQPLPIFHVWQRLGLFTIVVLVFTNLIDNQKVSDIRLTILHSVLTIAQVYSVASFFAYFMGINYFMQGDEYLSYNTAGHFGGFTRHSMLLGPLAGFSSIYTFAQLFKEQERGKSKWRTLLLIFVLVTSFGSLLLSASRAALLSTLLAYVIQVLRMWRDSKKNTIRVLVLVGIVLLALFPLWEEIGVYVLHKNQNNIEHGGIFYSRSWKYNARLYEIRNNFFSGVGFSAIDPTVDTYSINTGAIEPGSSWLSVFSMTGLFGVILFFIVIMKAILRSWKIVNMSKSMLLSGLMTFFIVHMIVEGYALAGGSILCAVLWLTVGCGSSWYQRN